MPIEQQYEQYHNVFRYIVDCEAVMHIDTNWFPDWFEKNMFLKKETYIPFDKNTWLKLLHDLEQVKDDGILYYKDKKLNDREDVIKYVYELEQVIHETDFNKEILAYFTW